MMDKTNGHNCTSDCRRNGCPLCIHGVHEDIQCDVCDKQENKNNIESKVEEREITSNKK